MRLKTQPVPRRGKVILNFTGEVLTSTKAIVHEYPRSVREGFSRACIDVKQMHKSELIVVSAASFYDSVAAAEIEAAARSLRSLPLDCTVTFSTGPDAEHLIPRDKLPRRFLRLAAQNREHMATTNSSVQPAADSFEI